MVELFRVKFEARDRQATPLVPISCAIFDIAARASHV
jgi:hypothetical protein